MKNKTHHVLSILDARKQNLTKKAIPFDRKILDNSISSFYAPGPSFQYIFDYHSQGYSYVSKNAFDLVGIEESTLTPEVYYNRIHPDDLAYIQNCEDISWYFLYQVIDKEAIPFYKVTYQVRLKDKNGNYKLTLHQAMAISMDEDGRISNVLANESDISHITTINNHRLSFIDTRGEKSYYNISCKEDFLKMEINLKSSTPREIEILKLISEGIGSKEIAEQLHLSYDTIRTHRNNILKRTKFKTIPQVISHYIRHGLI